MSEPSKAAVDAAEEFLKPLLGDFCPDDTYAEMNRELAAIIDRHARSAEVVMLLKRIKATTDLGDFYPADESRRVFRDISKWIDANLSTLSNED
jgi:hypothetical protein